MLVSACDHAIGVQVAQQLGFFSDVLTSDGRTNLKGRAKAQLLNQRFGARGFYAGNSRFRDVRAFILDSEDQQKVGQPWIDWLKMNASEKTADLNAKLRRSSGFRIFVREPALSKT